MELELKKTCLDAYETSAELTLTQEETAETIVPDYCRTLHGSLRPRAGCFSTAGSSGTAGERSPERSG